VARTGEVASGGLRVRRTAREVCVIGKDIEAFLLAEIAVDFENASINPETDLIEHRVIDSLTILKLVTFLEESCGIAVLDEDIVPENFKNVNSLVKFVEQKRRGE
jgi:acyl carrier protein